MAKESLRANLAIRRTVERVDPRVQLRRLQVAFIAIVHGARRMPDRWYGLTERNRTCSYPFEREREFIHEAIRNGCTSPDRVISYHLTRLQDDLAQFPEALDASEVLYRRLVTEQAEAIEAQTLAHALATEEARERAVRETEEAITLGQLYVMDTRRDLPNHPLPMGAVR